MSIAFRVLQPGDDLVLHRVAPDVFDQPINAAFTSEFLRDARHHLAVAIDQGIVVGFASAVHYLHPDKPPELWINEVGVAPAYRQQGLGRGLLEALLAVGRELGCRQAWVLTDAHNSAAVALYASKGGLPAAGDTVMYEFPL